MTFDEESLIRSVSQESYFDFLLNFWDVFVGEKISFNWHIEYLCNELQKVAEWVFHDQPKEYDLVINISPGSTKSTIVSQAFGAWTWTRMPSMQHINGSYAHALALRDAIRCRDIIQSPLYQKCWPHIQLREDQNTKGLFVNTLKGGRLAVGVRGQVTGYHGHILGVDDPINPEESFSEAELRTVSRWMETTLPSRGLKKADTPLILCGQRLSQGDPSGETLAKAADGKLRVKHICIPAELTEGALIVPPELAVNYVDGLFDPVRLNRRNLEEMKIKLGAYGYASQYLQDPVPLGGGLFKTEMLKLEMVPEAPRMKRIIRSWDKAGTPDGGNWSAGVLIGIDKNDEPWILDVQRGQWAAADRESMILQTAQLDNSGAYGHLLGTGGETHVTTIIEIEGGSGGIESAEGTVKNLAGYPIQTYRPTGTKEARAYNFASHVGLRYHVHVLVRPWTRGFVEELRYFPYGRYDDQVDASSSGYTRIARKPRIVGAIRLDNTPRRESERLAAAARGRSW